MSNITKSLTCALFALSLITFSNFQLNAQDGSVVAVVTAKRSAAGELSNSELEKQARFPGCEKEKTAYSRAQCSEEKLRDYIIANLEYPARSKSSDFDGVTVNVEFTVEATGMIHSFKIPRPNVKEYDVNALKVFEKMVEDGIKWTPGKVNNEPIRTTAKKNICFDIQGRDKAFPEFSLGDDVYELVDEVPAFKTCQGSSKKDREILDCTLESLDGFFRENMIYPKDALTVGLEGDIEVDFIVDHNGLVRNVEIKNDLGLGTSEEAFRLMLLMNDKNIGWVPGEEDGRKVNVQLATTVHFRIDPSAKPKTKLRVMDAKPVFVTERKGFEDYMESYLRYPVGEDVNPCGQGVIDVKFKVNRGSGSIEITEMVDYNNLGKEFKASATDFIMSTKGDWEVDYSNLGPQTEYYLSIPFMPNKNTCPSARDDYKEMVYKAISGEVVVKEKGDLNDGLKLLDDALRLYPADNKMRYLRGNTLYKAGRIVEGCVDLSFVNKQNKDIVVPKSCK